MASLTKATELYKSATATSGSGDYRDTPAIRIIKLEDALKLYHSELNLNSASSSSQGYDAHLSLCKNIAMASLRLAQAMVEGRKSAGVYTPKVIYHVKECVRNLMLNWLWRPAERDNEWGDKVMGSVNAAFDVAFRSLGDATGQNWPKDLHHLDAIVKEIGDDPCLDKFRLRFYTERAHFYNRSASKLMEKSNFILTQRVLEYSRCDCDLARKYASLLNPSIFEPALLQLSEMEDVTKFLKASCDSVKLRSAADELLQSALNDSEQLNFELMWDILDMYKAAAISAANEDIKNETIAIARQGMLFDKVFKLEAYARMYCHKAVELANILMVPAPGDKWFWECLAVISEYQKRQREEEERKKEEERAPFIRELEEEIKELKAVEDCTFKTLKHVYAKHPPKTDPKFKYDEKQTTPETVRKVLMKAIFHYHPDKQAGFGKKWQVLCEEITKRLNVKWTVMKGV